MSHSATPWTITCLSPLFATVSQSLLKFMFTESVMLPNHFILCCPLLLLPSSSPASQSFPMNHLCIRWPSIGASASATVLPVNIHSWFPLGLTSLISLLSKGLSRVFSSTTIQKHHFFGTQPSYGPALTSGHDYCKDRSFDSTALCWQSDVSAS